MIQITNRVEQNNSAHNKIKIPGFAEPVRMVREFAVSLCSGFCYTGRVIPTTPR